MLAPTRTNVRSTVGRTADHRPDAPTPANAPNIIAMLLEALSRPDAYEISERNGELFVTPIAAREDAPSRLAA